MAKDPLLGGATKTVVLGDLEKYNGNDVLSFDGISNSVVCGLTSDFGAFSCFFVVSNISLNGSYQSIYTHRQTLRSGVMLYVNNNNFFSLWLAANTGFVMLDSTVMVEADKTYNIDISFSTDKVLSITVNGVTSTTDVSGIQLLPMLSNKQVMIGMGEDDGGSFYFNGVVHKAVLTGYFNATYIRNGDFGSATLVDHSGSGNDGTINGAQWWKEGVDEVYASPQLLKDTLTTPLGIDYHVVYTDATPFYPSDDVFWNPYNLDPEFTFTVVQQGAGGADGASYTYSFSYNF